MKHEQITRGRLRAQISVEAIDGGVCIFCPAEVSERLYQHVAGKRLPSALPKEAIFNPHYPLHELTVNVSFDQALAEITEFVASLPEICYERDVT